MDELSLEARLDNMDAVLRFVEERIGDCPRSARNAIGIAVDEIFSNIARYAYAPAVGVVTVRVRVGATIVIEFEDGGTAYDPLDAREPDTSLAAAERDVGGLGIFLVKNLMDSVTYRRDGDRNVLVIEKAAR